MSSEKPVQQLVQFKVGGRTYVGRIADMPAVAQTWGGRIFADSDRLNGKPVVMSAGSKHFAVLENGGDLLTWERVTRPRPVLAGWRVKDEHRALAQGLGKLETLPADAFREYGDDAPPDAQLYDAVYEQQPDMVDQIPFRVIRTFDGAPGEPCELPSWAYSMVPACFEQYPEMHVYYPVGIKPEEAWRRLHLAVRGAVEASCGRLRLSRTFPWEDQERRLMAAVEEEVVLAEPKRGEIKVGRGRLRQVSVPTEWVIVLRYAGKLESPMTPSHLNQYVRDCLVPTIQGPTLEQAVIALDAWVQEMVSQLDRPKMRYCSCCKGAGVVPAGTVR